MLIGFSRNPQQSRLLWFQLRSVMEYKGRFRNNCPQIISGIEALLRHETFFCQN